MQNHLQKAINIAKISGDKVIVFDSPESENGYVVMNLDEYEKIVKKNSGKGRLTEQELIDNINRDIAAWKSEQDLSIEKNPINPGFFEEEEYHEDRKIGEKQGETKKKNMWKIPEERKEAAEEIIEEDRQYLIEI